MTSFGLPMSSAGRGINCIKAAQVFAERRLGSKIGLAGNHGVDECGIEIVGRASRIADKFLERAVF